MQADKSGSTELRQSHAGRDGWLLRCGLAVLLLVVLIAAAWAAFGHTAEKTQQGSTAVDASRNGSSFRPQVAAPRASPLGMYAATPGTDAATLGVLNYLRVHARVSDLEILRLYHAEHANPD